MEATVTCAAHGALGLLSGGGSSICLSTWRRLQYFYSYDKYTRFIINSVLHLVLCFCWRNEAGLLDAQLLYVLLGKKPRVCLSDLCQRNQLQFVKKLDEGGDSGTSGQTAKKISGANLAWSPFTLICCLMKVP